MDPTPAHERRHDNCRLPSSPSSGATGLLVVAGFVIGSISVFVLRVLALLGRSYEAFLTADSFSHISQYLKVQNRPGDDLYLLATLDHEVLSERMSSWVRRRWSNFYICLNSAVALGLGWAVVWYFGFSVTLAWKVVTATTAVMLLILSAFAWWDTMGMLDFQGRRLRGSSNGFE